MDIVLIVAGIFCLLGGIVGCIVPMLPGPPLAYVGMLLFHFSDKVQFSTTQLLVWLVCVAVVQLLDYIVPMLGSRYSGGSKWGEWGCVIGTFIGLAFMPWGLVAGPFLGAFFGELLAKNEFDQALKSGIGSLVGFFFGIVVKVALCGYFLWQSCVALW